MFRLIKNAHCYAPENIGEKDILFIYGKIFKIGENLDSCRNLECCNNPFEMEVYDCEGKLCFPGFIDIHVHITGGGGEHGEKSRIPEITLSSITTAGVTTVVGVLGMDDVTRSMLSLVAKARALEKEGITTFIYTGSYAIPTVTVCGDIKTDLVAVDKVIGVGEIAISDYRSSQPTPAEFRKIASQALLGGMISGKAGIVHIHVGDGKDGLKLLLDTLNETELPVNIFLPTHANRNKRLFQQSLDYLKSGGSIDLTAGISEGDGVSVPDGLAEIIKRGLDTGSVTVSSDGNGSMPGLDGGTAKSSRVGQVKMLFDDIVKCIKVNGLDPSTVIKTVTVNPARIMKLYPARGALMEGSDADILVLNNDYTIDKVFCRGELTVNGGKPVKTGTFEQGNKDGTFEC